MTEQEVKDLISTNLNKSTDNKGYTYKTIIIIATMAFVAGLFIGVKYLSPALTTNHTTTNTVEKQPIYITGTTTTDTKLQYVKGDTVYLPSPATNTGLTTPVSKDTPNSVATKLDGKFDIGKPDFTYQVNGKVGKFTKTDDEQYIFDKGMVDLKQTSTINIVADIPTIDKTKNGNITFELTNKDVSANINYKKLGVVVGKMYDGDLRFGASYTPVRF